MTRCETITSRDRLETKRRAIKRVDAIVHSGNTLICVDMATRDRTHIAHIEWAEGDWHD